MSPPTGALISTGEILPNPRRWHGDREECRAAAHCQPNSPA